MIAATNMRRAFKLFGVRRQAGKVMAFQYLLHNEVWVWFNQCDICFTQRQ
jgi:hypothetical protein